MKRKFLATLAMLVLVLVGSFSPVLGFFADNLQPKVAYAGGPLTPPAAAAPTSTATDLDCGINVICGIVSVYDYFTLFLPNLLAELSGMTLDYVVWKNLQSDTWTSQDQASSFVVKGWDLVRDLSNLLFIFALFIVAFSLILNGMGDGQPLFGLDPKRTIARVILMALLINFSFFMCRVIIDMTNLFAGAFYDKITISENANGQNASQSVGTTDSNGISGKLGTSASYYASFGNGAKPKSISLGILGKVNPQQLVLKTVGNTAFTGTSSSFLGIGWKSYDTGIYVLLIFVSTMVGLFNFFLAYLFLSSAIFLISRIFGLFFLIILSPIAFVSTTIPAFQKKEYFGFDDWFTQLTGLAFCLPIYMFFIWLSLFFLSAGTNGGATTGYIAAAGIIVIKLLMMGAVLIFGKKISKDLSGKFGAMATSVVTGAVTGAAMIAGAAMTGGASAALSMTGRVAANGASTAARGIGGAVLGDERAEAWEQKVKGFRTGGFKRLNNFNAADMVKGTGTLLGSKTIGGLPDAYGQGTHYGTVMTRAKNIKDIRDEKQRKIKDINAKLIDANKKYYDPNTPPAEKARLKMDIDSLEAQKGRVERGEPEPVRNAPPNAGTSGNNAANKSGGNTTGNGTTNNTTNNSTTNNTAGGAGGNPGANPNPGTGGTNTNNGTTNSGPNAGTNSGASTNAGTGGATPPPGGAGAPGGPRGGNTNNNSGAGGGAGGAGGGFNSGSRGGGNYNNASGGPGGNKSGDDQSSGAKTSNPYEALGLDANASPDEIKKAFRNKTKENHPDKGGSEDAMQKINDAYEQIQKDPKFQAAYAKSEAAKQAAKTAASSATASASSASTPSASRTVDLLNNIQNVTPRAADTGSAGSAIVGGTVSGGAMALGTGALALGMGSSVPATTGETPTLKDKVVSSISSIPLPQSQLSSSIDTITDVAHGKVPSFSSIVNPGGGGRMSTVGHEVDNIAKVNDIPGVQYVPEVGEIAKGAGEMGALAKSAGITEQSKAMDIPLPPSTTRANDTPAVRSDLEIEQWKNIARAQNIDALQKKFNSDKSK